MMDKLKKNMVFYLLLLIDFYIVPWFIKNTGSAMIVMLVIIPLICLITSVFYGIRNGFNFWYILIVAIMFAPSIFIFYNSSAWVYVVGSVSYTHLTLPTITSNLLKSKELSSVSRR